jgi:hypothetical protein
MTQLVISVVVMFADPLARITPSVGKVHPLSVTLLTLRLVWPATEQALIVTPAPETVSVPDTAQLLTVALAPETTRLPVIFRAETLPVAVTVVVPAFQVHPVPLVAPDGTLTLVIGADTDAPVLY